MNKNNIVKATTVLLLLVILLSTVSLSVFATDSTSGEEAENIQKEYTFWEDLEMFGFLIFAAIVSPILTLANWLHELFGFAPLI